MKEKHGAITVFEVDQINIRLKYFYNYTKLC